MLLKRAGKKEGVERTIRIVDELLDGIWFAQKISPLKPEEIRNPLASALSLPWPGVARDRVT